MRITASSGGPRGFAMAALRKATSTAWRRISDSGLARSQHIGETDCVVPVRDRIYRPGLGGEHVKIADLPVRVNVPGMAGPLCHPIGTPEKSRLEARDSIQPSPLSKWVRPGRRRHEDRCRSLRPQIGADHRGNRGPGRDVECARGCNCTRRIVDRGPGRRRPRKDWLIDLGFPLVLPGNLNEITPEPKALVGGKGARPSVR